MNREKLAWMLSLVLIAVLAFELPGSFAQRDDDYAFVRTLVDIHRQVENNYVEPVDDAKLREGAVDGMMGQLDPFSVYIPALQQEDFDRMLEGSFKGVGIQLNQLEDGRIEVVSPIEGSPALKAGVLAGDIITKVNGELLPSDLKLPDVIRKVSGPVGTDVTLTVKHLTGDVEDLTIKREEIIVPTVKGYARSQDGSWDWYASERPKIGFIRVTQFTPDTAGKMREAIDNLLKDGMQGLILDLRFNPGGRLEEAVQMVDMFVKPGAVIVKTRGRNRPERVEYATPDHKLPVFPMIVLVNEHSASAAEIVAGSLLDNGRAAVLGMRTYGKGSVQELISLEGGGELKLTVAYWYLPSGRLVHHKKDATTWGVEPSITVSTDPATEKRILQDRLEQELYKRPVLKTATQAADVPTTQPVGAATAAATQPVDPQLQQAVTTIAGWIVLGPDRFLSAVTTAPAAQSTTDEAPATPQ